MPNDPELPKEAVLHAQRDMRNIRPGPSVQGAVIAHAQRDMAALAPEPPAQERGLVGQATDQPALRPGRPKIGAEHAKSMAKLGLHELTQALPAFPDSNIRPLEEPGVFGNEAMPHIQDHDAQSRASRDQDKDRSRTR